MRGLCITAYFLVDLVLRFPNTTFFWLPRVPFLFLDVCKEEHKELFSRFSRWTQHFLAAAAHSHDHVS